MSVLHRRQGPLFMSSVESGPYNLGPGSTPLLDTINSPADMKRFNIKQLKQLSHELRWDVINAVSKTGGHLGSSLGVIELTVALHYLFDAPEDKIVWDVAHQSYPHKILTGRRNQMSTLRQLHGLSGFTNRNESVYDCFGAGHSSTSISAGRLQQQILLNTPLSTHSDTHYPSKHNHHRSLSSSCPNHPNHPMNTLPSSSHLRSTWYVRRKESPE
jgi:hypothetical protein